MSDNCATWDQEQKWCVEQRQDRWISKHSVHSLVEEWTSQSRERLEKVQILVREAQRPVEQSFHEQADKWERETEHLSSPTQMMMHPSYQAILGMAVENKQEVISLMLQDLRNNRREWFWALSYLTQDNPISPRDAGKMDKMIKAWVDWGRRKGLL